MWLTIITICVVIFIVIMGLRNRSNMPTGYPKITKCVD